MSARSYLSIGDVLTLLRQEFPDITISKIRFLESQGLVNPERTPSGYRKFYEHDVERLRWVLRQQREHFLPLKVIKDRLDDNALEGGPDDSTATRTKRGAKAVARDRSVPSTVDTDRDDDPVLVGQRARTEARSEPVPAHPAGDASLSLVGDGVGLPGIGSVDASSDSDGDLASAARSSAASPGSARGTSTSHRRTPDRSPLLELVDDGAAGRGRGVAKDPANGRGDAPMGVTASGPAAGGGAPDGTPPPGPVSRRARTPSAASGAAASGEIPGPDGSDRDPTTPPTRSASPTKATGRSTGKASDPPPAAGAASHSAGVSFSAEEVCATSGLELEVLRQLQEFGLVTAGTVAGVEHFDEDAMIVATVTARLTRFGIEPRHLRLYKNAADREAGFVEQIVLPLVRQRNPEARARAHETAEELTQLGQQLRGSLLRSALGGLLDG
jgi:DNA-binding transcriptional MerR regulator